MATAGSDFTEHRIPRDVGGLYAREYAGAGPTLVLMHGFPDNLLIYDDLVPYLVAGGRRVVTFDFLGFGASGKPAGAAYSFKQQLGDLEAIVESLDLGQAVLVPHDSSGIAAVNFAIDHPDRVSGLCILNSAFDDSALASWPEMVSLFADPKLSALALAVAESPAQFKWLLDWQREKFAEPLTASQRAHFDAVIGPLIADNFVNEPSAGPAFVQMAAQFYEELARNGARLPLVAALDLPVKVIWAEHDPYLNVAMGRERASRFLNAAFHLVPAGHWLQSDEPELVAQHLLS
jgi:haloalkane dehalogenase